MCILYKKSLLAGRSVSGALMQQPHGPGGDGHGSDSGDETDPNGRGNERPSSDRPAGASSTTKAEAETLMSVDAGRVINIMGSFHELWSLPLQMVIALYLLYLQVSMPILPGYD